MNPRDVEPTRIRLSPMQAENMMLDCEIVPGVVICDLNENTVSLPPMYTVDQMAVSKDNNQNRRLGRLASFAID